MTGETNTKLQSMKNKIEFSSSDSKKRLFAYFLKED